MKKYLLIQQKAEHQSMMRSPSAHTHNVDEIISKLIQDHQGKAALLEQEIQFVLRVSIDILLGQSSLPRVDAPVSICGDIHGQFNDLLRILGTNGFPNPARKYLFLGDYVDRGKQGVECLCLLLAFKIKHPDSIFLLRGNHESPSLNKAYGFYDQCRRKYSHGLWKIFVNCFDCMPPAALVSGSILCMHGGISPSLVDVTAIQDIKRPCQIGNEGMMCDLLWSDPDPNSQLFGESTRGISYTYGKNAVDLFCQANQLQLIVRAHEIVEDGYRFSFNRRVVTIFSAPNYCNKFSNHAGVLNVDKDLMCSIVRIPPVTAIKQEQKTVSTIGQAKRQRRQDERQQSPKNSQQVIKQEVGKKR